MVEYDGAQAVAPYPFSAYVRYRLYVHACDIERMDEHGQAMGSGARASARLTLDDAGYAAGHVNRALRRERTIQARRVAVRAAARRAAGALRERFGEEIAVYLFGSALDSGQFHMNSDIDLAVLGLPPDRYFEAWALAESAADAGPVDFLLLEDAPDWLAAEVRTSGEAVE